MIKKKGERAHLESAVQRIVVSCVRGEDESLSKRNLLIDSLPIGWTVGAMIYFTGEVSGSSPGWPTWAKEEDGNGMLTEHREGFMLQNACQAYYGGGGEVLLGGGVGDPL